MIADPLQPKWLQDIERLLPIRAQFVLSGNIRDRFLTPMEGGLGLTSFLPCLWAFLQSRGYAFILVCDPLDGLRIYPDSAETLRRAETLLDVRLVDGAMPATLDTLRDRLRRLTGCREARLAAVVDYASRIPASLQNLTEAEKAFFAGCEKLAHTALPQLAADGQGLLYNPVIWLLNRAQDLPSWLVLDSEKIHSLEIARPDYEQRLAAARSLIRRFPGAAEAAAVERESTLRLFADATDGLSLQAMSDISQLAATRKIPVAEIDDAIRCFKVGAVDNPWKKDYLRDKIRSARGTLEDRVKGQHPAITKTIDILTRSVMGLTGAQARASSSRPRGVLFFAGPTGVGKTELAKALTQLMFGDERAYIRFDMSEFADAHTGARLLGAPPGYVGYEAGGELTNAIHQRPFCVLLFDEIEKAHPSLLDKFLQILEDGRLTDGRGETLYFSEAVIIFTSNLGSSIGDGRGGQTPNVVPGDAYEVVERRIRDAIGDYFKYQLSRPELLNRIGDNIVVFNFIGAEVAASIFDGMLRNILRRVEEEHGLALEISAPVRARLLELCTGDLAHGGRGIGNRLETTFINPLARALFARDLEGCRRLAVLDASEVDGVYSLTLGVPTTPAPS